MVAQPWKGRKHGSSGGVGGQIQPIIGARLPLAKIGTANRMIERAETTGKIVLVPV
jgi:hypothetical protein